MQLPKTFPCNYFESNACKCFVTFLAELYSKLKKTLLLSEHIKIIKNTIFYSRSHSFCTPLIVHESDRASFISNTNSHQD